MRSLLGRFHRPFARGVDEQLLLLNNLGDGSTLSLDFTTGVLDPRLTFTRASGGTYVGNDGFVYGVDFATSSSLAIGTGSKSVTLTATAGASRRYEIGQTVYIANGANNMSGAVTAYNASTQVLTINATSTSGSGSFTSWIVGNASARFDYDPSTLQPRGLLIEGSASNYGTYSESFATSGPGVLWTYSDITKNAILASSPAGNNDAAQFNETTVNTIHRISQFITAASGAVTISVWAKAIDPTTPRRLYVNAIGLIGCGALFDLDPAVQTGASGTAVNVAGTAPNRAGTWVKYPNGWYRCSIVGTYVAAATIYLQVNRASSTVATDDTYSGSTANGLMLYGFQTELGSGASSYIPTGASQGSRAVDACFTTSISSWFTNGPGTIVAHSDNIRTNTRNLLAQISDGTANNYVQVGLSAVAASGEAIGTLVGGALQGFSQSGSSPSLNTVYKSAYVWDTNYFRVCQNGTLSTADTTGTLATALDRLAIGTDVASSSPTDVYMKYGHIRLLKYWPTRLSDAQLQALTT